MGEKPLVDEHVAGGWDFLLEFDKHVPVSVAFWLREDEEAEWYLYVASDKITEANLGDFHKVVVEVGRPLMRHPYFKFYNDVNLLPGDDPMARDVRKRRDGYDWPKPVRYRDVRVGNRFAEEICIYPPISTPVAAE